MITGEELRRARQHMGLTQEQLADVTEFSPRQICRFENNENLKKFNKYLKLSEVLQIVKINDEE